MHQVGGFSATVEVAKCKSRKAVGRLKICRDCHNLNVGDIFWQLVMERLLLSTFIKATVNDIHVSAPPPTCLFSTSRLFVMSSLNLIFIISFNVQLFIVRCMQKLATQNLNVATSPSQSNNF